MYIILFFVALLYAGVGHGGASGYLALMALYGVAPEEMKPTALALNLLVSFASFVNYFLGKYFRPQIFVPLILGSIPMAYLGGRWQLDAEVYKQVLGVLLLFAVGRFFLVQDENKSLKQPNWILAVFIGGIIGLFSGMIGIGGGILLSPILLLLYWTDQKQTAAISAGFIFVNSLSGLLGMISKGVQFSPNMWIYLLVTFAGGLVGAYLGARRLNYRSIKFILAAVLFLAAIKLIFI